MSDIQLNAACKVDNNACTLLLGDYLNLLSDNCFQCSNGVKVALLDIFEEPSEEEILEPQVRCVRYPFFNSIVQGIIWLYLVEYIKMLTISCKEKNDKTNTKLLRGHCFI